MKRIICRDAGEVSEIAAAMIAEQIFRNRESVIGLATGSTPEGLYGKLREMYENGDLDFSGVRTFNLDEYYPIRKSNDQSYDCFMRDKLFSHINVKMENIHIPNGECSDPAEECIAYEQMIAEAGGVDIQVLGIGLNGHIGFNEPERELRMDTHPTELTASTIEANSRFFSSIDEVPTKALTMGMGTIMRARSIILLITGAHKAAIAKKIFSGVVTTEVPASFLNLHPNTTVLLDEAAASEL
ncbi:MAG: glucosamine-6-phosphate deaminase [Clostridiales bacterium]|nr:glucosamine-6-phosphate deaminase [Clostridiales bacterium]